VTPRLRRALRALRRDPSLVLLAIRVYVLLIVMRGLVRALPLRRITERLGEPMSETSTDGLAPEQLAHARRIGQVIERLAPSTPTNSNCYPQALTARWLLHRRQIPSTVYYGAAFEAGQPALEAHVWVRSGPLIVTGGGRGRHFRALTWFADQPTG
jgi:hypothetical protein